MTDVVITYVDGRDPEWQEEYRSCLNVPALAKRYRDWGTLRYLMRGIGTCMPFVRRIHLVVSSMSQVPAWVDPETVHIVLHRDIIPAEYLPTFNSCAIEMFLHRIPDLAEQYIYFNDDMFPVAPCEETDFFVDGKIRMGFSWCLLTRGLYRKQTCNSDRVARKALGIGNFPWFIRPQHTCSPMLRPWCEDLYSQMEADILASLSPIREGKNLNQYVYLDYLYYGGQASVHRLSNKHFSLAAYTGKQVCDWLRQPTHKLACINDVHLSEEKYEAFRSDILEGFDFLFPDKSRFEK